MVALRRLHARGDLRVELDYAQWLRIACPSLCGLMNPDCFQGSDASAYKASPSKNHAELMPNSWNCREANSDLLSGTNRHWNSSCLGEPTRKVLVHKYSRCRSRGLEYALSLCLLLRFHELRDSVQ